MKRANGTGSVQRVGRKWRLRVSTPTGMISEMVEADSRTEAINKLNDLISQVRVGKVSAASTKLTVRECYDLMHADYTVNDRRVEILVKRWKHLEPWFGHLRASDVTTEEWMAYAQARKQAGAANATISLERAALRRMLNLAHQARKLPVLPYLPPVEVDNVREDILEHSDYLNLRKELPPYLKPVFVTAYWLGFRRSELFALKPRHYEEQSGRLRLEGRMTKTGQPRYVYLPDEVAACLKAWRRETRKLELKTGTRIEWLFHRNGKQIKDAYAAWRSACKRAGIEGAWLHDCRRTAARNYRQSGIERDVIKRITGHKTDAMFTRYNIVRDDDLQEAAAAVGQRFDKRPAKGRQREAAKGR